MKTRAAVESVTPTAPGFGAGAKSPSRAGSAPKPDPAQFIARLKEKLQAEQPSTKVEAIVDLLIQSRSSLEELSMSKGFGPKVARDVLLEMGVSCGRTAFMTAWKKSGIFASHPLPNKPLSTPSGDAS